MCVYPSRCHKWGCSARSQYHEHRLEEVFSIALHMCSGRRLACMVRTVTEPCRAALTATLHGPKACDRCNSRNCGCQAGWLQSCKTHVINCSAYTTSRRRAHMWRPHARSCVAPPCIATPSCPPATRNNQIVKGSKLLSCTHRTNVIHQQFMLLLLINASSVNCNYILLSGQSFWQLPMLQPDRCILVSQLNNFMRPKSQHVVQQQQTTPGKQSHLEGRALKTLLVSVLQVTAICTHHKTKVAHCMKGEGSVCTNKVMYHKHHKEQICA